MSAREQKEALLSDLVEQNERLKRHEAIARIKEDEIDEARRRLKILETRLQLTKDDIVACKRK